MEAEIIPDGRDIMETKKSKNINRGKETPCGKRRKMDNTEGIVWGETVEPEIVARNNFLTSNQPNHTTPRQKRQSQLNIITGLEWIAYETVKSVVHEAVNLAEYLKEMTTWPQWINEIPVVEDNNQKTIKTAQQDPSRTLGQGDIPEKPLALKSSMKRGKKKILPGVTATQRGVQSFYSKIPKISESPPPPLPLEQSHSTPIEMSKTTKRTQMVQPNPDMHDKSCSEISERGPPLNQAEIVKNEPPEDDQNPPKTTNYLHTAENLAKESPAKRRNKSET